MSPFDIAAALTHLKPWGLETPEAFWAAAFSRDIGILTRPDLRRLSHSRVAIPGAGGVGGVHAATLARSGIGKFHLADFDRFEPANINRQYGARVFTLNQPKTDVIRDDILAINPFAEIQIFPEGVSPENVEAFLTGVDVVLDSLDFFALPARRLIFRRARERGIPVVTAGPIGFGTPVLVFTPEGMSFDDYFDVRDGMDPLEGLLRFYCGLAPKAFHRHYTDPRKIRLAEKIGPSLSLACQLATGFACTEIFRLLLHRPGVRPAPYYLHVDSYLQKFDRGRLRWGNRGPLQRFKLWLARRGLTKNLGRFRPIPKAPAWNRQGPIPQPVMDYLLTAGLQAPSGDNMQPWALRQTGDQVDLLLNAEGDTSFFNLRQRATLISNGAIVENMAIAATAYGLETTVIKETTGDSDPTVASLRFTSAGKAWDPLTELIWERDTNRRPYDRRPIPSESVAALDQAATDRGARLHLLTEPSGIQSLVNASYWADRARIALESCHRPLYKAVRKNAAEARARGDGFSFANLNAGWDGRLFFTLTRSWRIMALANRLGIGNKVADVSRKIAAASSAVGLLTMPGASAADFFRGGRAWERLWLAASAHGLALQPMASLTLFWLRWREEGEGGFPPHVQEFIQRGMSLARPLFPFVDWDRDGLVMLFRLGYAGPISEGTFRKPLSHFLKPS